MSIRDAWKSNKMRIPALIRIRGFDGQFLNVEARKKCQIRYTYARRLPQIIDLRKWN